MLHTPHVYRVAAVGGSLVAAQPQQSFSAAQRAHLTKELGSQAAHEVCGSLRVSGRSLLCLMPHCSTYLGWLLSSKKEAHLAREFSREAAHEICGGSPARVLV